jgi:hypothetical protein
MVEVFRGIISLRYRPVNFPLGALLGSPGVGFSNFIAVVAPSGTLPKETFEASAG